MFLVLIYKIQSGVVVNYRLASLYYVISIVLTLYIWFFLPRIMGTPNEEIWVGVSSLPNYKICFTQITFQGGATGASSFLFVYPLDYARTRPANDTKAVKKGGERQFN
ncbi:hypothetical protein IFM89_012459, partial [Coptis chinensis]